MTMNIAIGVIGSGDIARFHFNAYAAIGVTVRAIADVSPERAQPQLDRFDAEFEPSWERLVARSDIDAVVVLTPSVLHYPMCKAALQNGKHVVCEKTLTLTGTESLELAELARARGLCLFTSYMKRFFPATQQVRRLIQERLGCVTSVHCRTFQGIGRDVFTGEVPAAFTPGAGGVSPVVEKSGGGVLVCGGSHILDLLLYLVGKPVRVYGRRWVRDGYDADFMAHALMDMEGGAIAHVECNWHPYTRIGYERRGWDEGFEINGTGGRLLLDTPVWNAPEHNAPRLRFYDTAAATWQEFTFDVVCPFQQAEAHFMRQIAAGQQGDMDRYVGYRVDHLLELITRSADEGGPLDVDWHDQPESGRVET